MADSKQEEIRHMLDGVKVTTEMTADIEFESKVWPDLREKFNAEYQHVPGLKSFLGSIYRDGAVYGAISGMEAVLIGARRGTQDLIAAERERCAKIAESISCIYPGPALRIEGFDLAKNSIAIQIREVPESQSELANPAKADDIARFCRYWWLATPKGLADTLTIPANWGLIEVDAIRKDDGTFKMKTAVSQKAAELTPQPMDTLFVCSVLRSFSGTHVLKSVMQKQIDDAVKKGVEQRTHDRGSRLSEMEAALVTFKERSGIDLMADYGRVRWDIPAVADAVKLILDMRGRPLEEMMQARQALAMGVSAIDAAVGHLLNPARPEPKGKKP